MHIYFMLNGVIFFHAFSWFIFLLPPTLTHFACSANQSIMPQRKKSWHLCLSKQNNNKFSKVSFRITEKRDRQTLGSSSSSFGWLFAQKRVKHVKQLPTGPMGLQFALLLFVCCAAAQKKTWSNSNNNTAWTWYYAKKAAQYAKWQQTSCLSICCWLSVRANLVQ